MKAGRFNKSSSFSPFYGYNSPIYKYNLINKKYGGKKMGTAQNIIKGIGISILLTLVLLIIFSIVLTYTNVNENTINPVIMIISALSILVGSSIVNTKIRKNGLLNGAFIGGLYILIIYIISSLLNWRFSLNFQSIIMIILGIVFGILGGIIGVNKK